MAIETETANTFENAGVVIRLLETRAEKFSKVLDSIFEIKRYDIISDLYKKVLSDPRY